MRAQARGFGITVNAVAGTHTVLLGFDLEAPTGCLGFGIRRTDHDEGETIWLRGMKTFASVVADPPPGSDWSTRDHPVQAFQWGDYTAKPGHEYTYVVTAFGGVATAKVVLGTASVRVRTEREDDGVHGVWFNRGVAGSQAYGKRFGGYRAGGGDETDPAMRWLSRGLGEAFVRFTREAGGPEFGLRGAFYEFTWLTGLRALHDAHGRGADVQLVVHGRDRDPDGAGGAPDDPDDERNEDRTAEQAREAVALVPGLADLVHWRSVPNAGALLHDKFLVLTHHGEPAAVWTGSTNLTQGGVFGHSNVGHLVRDPGLARHFLDEWQRLREDRSTGQLRADRATGNPVTEAVPPSPGVGVVFSPRQGLSVLDWYGRIFDSGTVSAHITGAFGLNKVFVNTLDAPKPTVVRTVLLESWPRSNQLPIPRKDPNVRVSTGAHLSDSSLQGWARERLTGFNTHVKYVHTKIVLVDPLGDDPVVLTGSANYSDASTQDNEENTLVIRGGGTSLASSPAAVRRVADIYLTEYHRLFMHFVFRAWAQRRKVNSGEPRDPQHLAESDSWTTSYYREGSWQALQRKVFSGQR